MTMDIRLYTDGGCKLNHMLAPDLKDKTDSIGAWAFVMVVNGNIEMEVAQYAFDVTNNQMEMLAVIEALKVVDFRAKSLTVLSDSQYTIKGISSWIHGWILKGWQTSTKEPVKNKELWGDMYKLAYTGHNADHIAFQWVKGHNGNKFNERADKLCGVQMNLAAQMLRDQSK